MKKLLFILLLVVAAVFGADAKVKGKVVKGNSIEVWTDTTGTYTLMYEGSGRQSLADYAPICTLEVSGTVGYEDFIDVNTAPREARTIGVYDSENRRVGEIRLAALKSKSAKTPLYSFGVLTDVHYGVPKIDPVNDFERALDFFAAQGASMVCVCGDISEKGLEEDFKAVGEALICTDNGTYGTHGFVSDLLREHIGSYTSVCACGPKPMLRALAMLAEEAGIPCQVSMEERMGCGFGACMGCSCKTKYGNKRICKDGPVMEREEIIW